MSIGGYETWGGGKWELTINGTNYDENFILAEFDERVSEPVQWVLDLQGVEASNADFDEGNIVEMKYDGTKAFKGRILESDVNSDLRMRLEGEGMSFDLKRRRVTNSWSSTDTTTIVSNIVGSTMNVGTNNSLDASADFRAEDESKLKALNRLANSYDGEWWVDESGGSDQFNIDTQRGGGSSIATFKDYGSDANAEATFKTRSQIEGNYDGVKVLGAADGPDQISATAGSTGSNDEVLVVTDKTIETTTEAQQRANRLNSKHGGSFTVIRVIPADPNQIFDVGDVITVDSNDADISSTDYRIVERRYEITYESSVRAEFICNDKPRTFFNRVEENSEETKSQTQYQQMKRKSTVEDSTATSVVDETNQLSFLTAVNNLEVGGNQFSPLEGHGTSNVSPGANGAPTDSGGSSVVTTSNSDDTLTGNDGSWVTGVSWIFPSTDTAGAMMYVYLQISSSTADTVSIRVKESGAANYFPDSDGLKAPIVNEHSGDVAVGPVTIKIPENTSDVTYDVQMKLNNATSSELWDMYTHPYTIGEHAHGMSSSNEGDLVDQKKIEYIEDDSSNIDVTSNQPTDTAANNASTDSVESQKQTDDRLINITDS